MKKSGKISRAWINDFVKRRAGKFRPEVYIGPQYGVDVAIVELPGGYGMALTSDPMSLLPSLGLRESAWLSIQLMVNDIATTGFAPIYGQFVLNLPLELSEQDYRTYWEHIHEFCRDLGISITGGHTGFIEGQHSTISGGGTLITMAPIEDLLVSSGAEVGDHLLVTKSCALSSSAILALSFPETVENMAGKEVLEQGRDAFYRTSVLQDALAAVGESSEERRQITAMHDVTEGGVLGALYELAKASGTHARVYSDRLPVEEAQRQICRIFDLDPRSCIGAGAMIIACKAEAVDAVKNRLEAQRIPCTDVGQLETGESRLTLHEKTSESIWEPQEQDPYWAAFFQAYNAGWK